MLIIYPNVKVAAQPTMWPSAQSSEQNSLATRHASARDKKVDLQHLRARSRILISGEEFARLDSAGLSTCTLPVVRRASDPTGKGTIGPIGDPPPKIAQASSLHVIPHLIMGF